MSGIAGVLHLDGAPALESTLQPMTGAMPGRVPDGVALLLTGSLGLAHGLLRTEAGAGEALGPATSNHLSVVADARIDNREDLVAALGLRAAEGTALTDAELILRTYDGWDEGCVDRIIGDFAFAVWDGKRRTLFLARDPFGARPLYYARTPRAFVFGSEVRAVLRGPGVPPTINEARIADFLVGQDHAALEVVDTETTLHAHVQRLLPGHVLTVSASRFSLRRAFWLEPRGPLRLRSTAEYAEALLAAFSEAVRCRLRGRSAAMLSGGLDSSAVVAVARRQRLSSGGPPLLTVSAIVEEEPWVRAAGYVRAVTALPGLDPLSVRPSDPGPGALERLMASTGDPSDYNMVSLTLPVYRAAATAGARVVLDGVDGDLAVSSTHDCIAHAFRSGSWRRGWELTAGLARCYESSRARVALDWGLRPAGRNLAARVPGLRALQAARRRRSARSAGSAGMVRLRPSFAVRIGLEDRLTRAWLLDHGPERGADSPLAEYLRAGRWLPLLPAFERYDRIATAAGVEARHPFGDRRLIELCAALPQEALALGGWPKGLLREALAGLLPEEIRWRPWYGDPRLPFARVSWRAEREGWRAAVREAEPLLGAYLDMPEFWERQRRSEARDDCDAALSVVAALTFWLRSASP
jgi:asparagine synthase (glutamine-hydrolysing)